jgi:hypothetical protein
MYKSHFRDYATEAFRFYAREGSVKKYKQKVLNEIIKRQKEREEKVTTGLVDSTGMAAIHAEEELELRSAELADLEAVEYAMMVLELTKGTEAVKALRIVYMTAPELDIKRGDIHTRVHAAESGIPASERSIYYWLSEGRRLFAEKRGLRLR